MFGLSEAGRIQLSKLFGQIIQQNPPLDILIMNRFSDKNDFNENIGENILEAILGSRIKSITELNLSGNSSWF